MPPLVAKSCQCSARSLQPLHQYGICQCVKMFDFQNIYHCDNDGPLLVRKGGFGFGIKPPLELDILQKLDYLRKGD